MWTTGAGRYGFIGLAIRVAICIMPDTRVELATPVWLVSATGDHAAAAEANEDAFKPTTKSCPGRSDEVLL